MTTMHQLKGRFHRRQFKSMRAVIILVVVLVLSVPDITYAEESSQWATEAINNLKAAGLFNSYKFKDYTQAITREDAIYWIVSLYEILQAETIEYSKGYYYDFEGVTYTQGDRFHFEDTKSIYADKAYYAGISSGISESEFGAKQIMDRQTLVTFLVKVLQLGEVDLLPESEEGFSDDDAIADWAKPYVYISRANGLVNGIGNNNFGPNQPATAETCMVLVDKFMKNLEGKDFKGNRYTLATSQAALSSSYRFILNGEELELATVKNEVTMVGVKSIMDALDLPSKLDFVSDSYPVMIDFYVGDVSFNEKSGYPYYRSNDMDRVYNSYGYVVDYIQRYPNIWTEDLELSDRLKVVTDKEDIYIPLPSLLDILTYDKELAFTFDGETLDMTKEIDPTLMTFIRSRGATRIYYDIDDPNFYKHVTIQGSIDIETGRKYTFDMRPDYADTEKNRAIFAEKYGMGTYTTWDNVPLYYDFVIESEVYNAGWSSVETEYYLSNPPRLLTDDGQIPRYDLPVTEFYKQFTSDPYMDSSIIESTGTRGTEEYKNGRALLAEAYYGRGGFSVVDNVDDQYIQLEKNDCEIILSTMNPVSAAYLRTILPYYFGEDHAMEAYNRLLNHFNGTKVMNKSAYFNIGDTGRQLVYVNDVSGMGSQFYITDVGFDWGQSLKYYLHPLTYDTNPDRFLYKKLRDENGDWIIYETSPNTDKVEHWEQ